MREVITSNLPKYRGNNIDWKNSIGQRVKFIYDGIEGTIVIVDYDSKTRKLWIEYLDKPPFEILTGNFQNCGIGKLLDKITIDFKVEIGTEFKDDNRDLIITDREYRISEKTCQNKKYYKYKCNKCGWEGDDRSWMTEGNLLGKEQGCSCCRGLTVVEHINSIVAKPETQWMIKYFQGGYNEAKLYTKNSGFKVHFKCSDCGRIKDKETRISDLYKRHSISCLCEDGLSFGYKYVYTLLEQLKVEFISNYTYDWCKFYNVYKNKETTGEYDFVIESLKIIIEVDGGFHRKDNKMNGQTKEESEYLDKEKNRLAEQNGYKVIRIIYNDDLEMKNPILGSEMVDCFDLSEIDWIKCEDVALSNLCKIACEYKRNNQLISTQAIGKLMNLSRKTITGYLKQGSNLGWCYYNSKDEMRKNNIKNGIIRSKVVKILKDDISLGVFKSTRELSRQSEELFGIKLSNSSISQVCNGKSKQHKGYTFKYIEDVLNEAI